MGPTARLHFAFLNAGHAYDHLFMLLFPTVVIALEREFARPYAELLPLATGGFVAFAACTLPAGWLGDRWSRHGMMLVFFLGIGAASVLTGLAPSPAWIAVGLTAIGVFASIYHPVGIAMVVADAGRVGRALGVNGVAGNLGVAFAALIAGALSDLWSWRAAFVVPGLVAIATGVAYAALLPRVRRAAGTAARGAAAARSMPPRRTLVRAFAALAVATFLGGLVFNATTVALPKVFDERLGGLVATTFGVGSVAALVYAAAAFAQLAVGRLIDRYAIKPVFIVVVVLQVPLLLAAQWLNDWAMLAVSFTLMLLVFGEIPIHDALVARYTVDAWRSRIYAVKYVLSLGVAAFVVPLVARLHGVSGDFIALFGLLAACAGGVTVAALLLPGARAEPLRTVAPAAGTRSPA